MTGVVAYQIPRNAMTWLLVAMFAGIIPHVDRLPIWVTLVCLLCGGWRIMVYRGRWALPGGWLRALLVFSGGAAVWGHYGTLMGPEAGSALLLLGFCFKLMETHTRRDAFVVVILGYFVVATAFFFRLEIVDTLYLLLVCFLVTAALLGLHQSPLQTAPRRTAWLAARLMLQSVPLTLVLFLLVPRIGPIWALEQPSASARTGLSDEMTPGDIARLSQSPALAFRVEFEGAVPATDQLYWRALVLDQFDGRTWRRHPQQLHPDWVVWPGNPNPWRSSQQALGQATAYRVIMEPTDKRWLFALDLARSDQRGIGQTRDFRLVNRVPVSQPFSYRVESALNHRLDPELPYWLARRNLQLPEDGNPRSRELALQLRQRSGDAEELVSNALALFRQQPFSYTLKPPLLSGDRVDQFLFDSRRGFCAHYAGALVFLLRAAGQPARVVTGYQGGEFNPLGNYVLVHQFDAHAWVEVWLPGKGWQRVDPTAVVAPSRVAEGLEQAVAGEGSFLADSGFSPLQYRQWAWVSQLRLGWDYLNFAWHRSVLGYDADSQRRWLSSWLGGVDWRRLGVALVVAIAAVLGVLALWVLWRNGATTRDPVLKEYQRLCADGERRGVARQPGEAPGRYLQRLGETFPGQARQYQQCARLLDDHLYRAEPTPGAVKRLRRLRRSLA
ncbi:transglutaminase TgpA family protein [Motiliproteus sediminis]|uniref:transglutaminase TgpA family protein n=1 Tax=Motiliproteus sediminis TaxID=1468178 RepID=UPI001AEFA110|nr:DUF3488 and DUF4129 domain-containing transglutaminase family protein [Motiliproteus sediminis]